MFKKYWSLVLAIMIISIVILSSCDSNKLALISFGNGIGSEYDSSRDYPIVLVKSKSELKQFSDEYRKYIGFDPDSYTAPSIDSHLKLYDEVFFDNYYLAFWLTETGVKPGNYKASYDIIDKVLEVEVKSKKSSETTAATCLILLVLEIPNSLECSSVNITVR